MIKIKGTILNNPFNVVKSSSKWQGKLPAVPGTDFEKFDTLENGIRAGLINLRNGYFAKGLDTPAKIINKYSPAHGKGNNVASTENYKSYLAAQVHGDRTAINDSLKGHELETAFNMIYWENGFDVVSWKELQAINKKHKVF